MCGIAGIIVGNGSPVSRERIGRMTRALAHRGPDGEGVEFWGTVAFGHRRLSIIDLETGKQPMCNENGRIWITYNGELYNFKNLRGELLSHGHVFKSKSDTEVIIHAYEQWGSECVKHFRGMFAFAIYDQRKQSVFLARDHFGIKPLYYRITPRAFSFASEIPALLLGDDTALIGKLQAVDYFLRYQYIPAPDTIYHGIYKLLPAHSVTVNCGDCTALDPACYWQLAFRAEGDVDESRWIEETENTVQESVRAHLVSDVPFGVFLSGGIDSSLIALSMYRNCGRDMSAFSIGFNEAEYSEVKHASYVAQKLGIQLHAERVDSTSLSMLPDLVAHYGEPFGDDSMIPTWHVAKLARSQVSMVLSGDGGDEGFAGYDSYLNWMTFSPLAHCMKSISRLHARSALHALWYWLRYRIPRGRDRLYKEWTRGGGAFFNTASRRELWKDEYQKVIAVPSALFEKTNEEARKLDRLSYAQHFDYRTYLPCDILTKVDISSMYHGLEVRTPLIDRAVVELITRMPPQMRFREGLPGSAGGKFMLKKLLEEPFGAEFVNRKKQGFALPCDKWFRPGSNGSAMFESGLHENGTKLHEWFHLPYINNLVETGQSSKLWSLLVLSVWLEQHKTLTFH